MYVFSTSIKQRITLAACVVTSLIVLDARGFDEKSEAIITMVIDTSDVILEPAPTKTNTVRSMPAGVP